MKHRMVRLVLTWGSYAPPGLQGRVTRTPPLSISEAKRRARSYGEYGLVVAIGMEDAR